MSSTKKTSSTQTTTPNAPSWVAPQTQALATSTANLNGQDPYSFVAGADPLQTKAGASASALTPNNQAYGSAMGVFQGLQDASTPQVSAVTGKAASLLPNIDQYMSPYIGNVVNSSLADYNFGAGQTQAQNKLALANDDTFGGSGGGVQTAMSNDAIDRGRASLVSGLLNTAQNQAATLSNEDADRKQQMGLANMTAANQAQQFNANQYETALNRQLQAGNGMVTAANSQNAAGVSDATTQANIGSILQQIAQAHAQAPLSVQQAINTAYGTLNPSNALLTGQTTTGKSTTSSGGLGSALGSLGSLAMGLGSLGLAPFTGGMSLAGLAGGLGGAIGGGAGLTGAADLAAFA